MLDMFSWLAENWLTLVTVALSVVGGASIMVKAIAPYTSTTSDDEVAGWLDKVHGWLSRIALNPVK